MKNLLLFSTLPSHQFLFRQIENPKFEDPEKKQEAGKKEKKEKPVVEPAEPETADAPDSQELDKAEKVKGGKELNKKFETGQDELKTEAAQLMQKMEKDVKPSEREASIQKVTKAGEGVKEQQPKTQEYVDGSTGQAPKRAA